MVGLCLISFIISPVSLAEVCEIKKVGLLLNKVEANHPALRIDDKLKKVAMAEVERASQRANPTFNLAANYGRFEGQRTSEGNVNFQYVFELGDKRNSRINLAEAEKKLGDFQIETRKEERLIEAALQIYRLIQIQTLLELYQESIEVFKKTRNSLRKTKRLSPEQETQEDILDIEVGKHRLEIAALQSELRHVENLLKYYAGEDCRLKLETIQIKFPEPQTFQSSRLELPEAKQIAMKAEVSQSQLDLERSRAVPDLKVGPSVQWEEERGQRIERYGIAMTMDLPILNRNQGGRAMAQAQWDAKQMEHRYFQAKNEVLLDAKLNNYQQLLNSLKESPSRQELLRKHHRIERYFTRGLISISTMLEGHDQLLGLIEDRDQNEMLALRTLFELQQAKGQLQEALNQWSQQ